MSNRLPNRRMVVMVRQLCTISEEEEMDEQLDAHETTFVDPLPQTREAAVTPIEGFPESSQFNPDESLASSDFTVDSEQTAVSLGLFPLPPGFGRPSHTPSSGSSSSSTFLSSSSPCIRLSPSILDPHQGPQGQGPLAPGGIRRSSRLRFTETVEYDVATPELDNEDRTSPDLDLSEGSRRRRGRPSNSPLVQKIARTQSGTHEGLSMAPQDFEAMMDPAVGLLQTKRKRAGSLSQLSLHNTDAKPNGPEEPRNPTGTFRRASSKLPLPKVNDTVGKPKAIPSTSRLSKLPTYTRPTSASSSTSTSPLSGQRDGSSTKIEPQAAAPLPRKKRTLYRREENYSMFDAAWHLPSSLQDALPEPVDSEVEVRQDAQGKGNPSPDSASKEEDTLDSLEDLSMVQPEDVTMAAAPSLSPIQEGGSHKKVGSKTIITSRSPLALQLVDSTSIATKPDAESQKASDSPALRSPDAVPRSASLPVLSGSQRPTVLLTPGQGVEMQEPAHEASYHEFCERLDLLRSTWFRSSEIGRHRLLETLDELLEEDGAIDWPLAD